MLYTPGDIIIYGKSFNEYCLYLNNSYTRNMQVYFKDGESNITAYTQILRYNLLTDIFRELGAPESEIFRKLTNGEKNGKN